MGMVLSKYKVKVLLLFILNIVLMPAYAIHALVGIELKIIFFFVSLFSLVIVFERRVFLGKGYYKLILFVVLLGAIGTALSLYQAQLLMGVSLGITIFVVVVGREYVLSDDFLHYSLIYMWLLLIGAVIGFVYVNMWGGGEIFSLNIYQYGSRMSGLYLTTFSDYNGLGLMQPSGLFDEPGALAMFVIAIVCINEMIGKNKYNSLLALVVGLVTGSLMIFIVFLLYLLFGRAREKSVLFLFLFAGLSILYYHFYDIMDYFFHQRLQFVDGRMVGDNRSHQVMNFFEIVDIDILMRGAIASNKVSYLDQSSNPFSILYGYGVVMWLIYFALELYLLYASVFLNKRVRYVSLVMFLTLLQRPYLFNVYWVFLIVLVVYCVTLYGQRASVKMKKPMQVQPVAPGL